MVRGMSRDAKLGSTLKTTKGGKVAWERRRNQKYLYRSIKVKGRVIKRYYGAGLEASMVEALLALARAEAAEAKLQTEMIREACELTETLCAASQVVYEATLLTWGYHRERRHAWSAWKNGRRVLESSRTVNGSRTARVG
jgi:hypothetical protein